MTDTREWQEGTTLTPPSEQQRSGGDLKGEAERVGRETVERGKGILDGQKQSAAESFGRIASVLHDTARNLRNEQPTVSRFFDEGADALDRFSGTLREQDTDTLLRQAQDFARRQPAVMLGGAVAVGFLLSRMLKSSSPHHSGEYLGEGRGFQKAREKMHSAGEELRSGTEGWKREFESKAEETREGLRTRRESREDEFRGGFGHETQPEAGQDMSDVPRVPTTENRPEGMDR